MEPKRKPTKQKEVKLAETDKRWNIKVRQQKATGETTEGLQSFTS